MVPMPKRLLLALLALLLMACDAPSPDAGDPAKPEAGRNVDDATAYVEQGDLEAIRKHGRLRILATRERETWLPRRGDQPDLELDLLSEYAHEQGLRPELVFVEAFADLIPALLAGKGDVIAADLRITPERREQIAFTVPLRFTREQLVARKDDPIRKRSGLRGRTVAIPAGTSFEQTLAPLVKKYGVHVTHTPPGMTLDERLDALAAGQLDLTMADSVRLEIAREYRDDFRVPFSLTGEVPLALGLRPDNPELKRTLDHFLEHALFLRRERPQYTDDLDGLKKKGRLRMLTVNNAVTYYLWKGELHGFEYEEMKRFAKSQGLHLEVIVAREYDDLIPMLERGEGDVIAALMTDTPQRRARGVHFSRRYLETEPVLVGGRDARQPASLEELAGLRIAVRPGTSHETLLRSLQARGIALQIEPLPGDLESEDILEQVAAGQLAHAVVDRLRAELARDNGIEVRILLPLDKPQPIAWAVRAENPKLLQAINAFWKKEYRGLHYNILRKRYFEQARGLRAREEIRIEPGTNHFTPWDAIVYREARAHGFDWRLILAQMYQESRFDPNRVSWAGARGLLQVTPRTARAHGFDPDKLSDPETGIRAGVSYLAWLRERFPETLDVRDRLWFALASYNAGLGHVRDARRLARQLGLNPNHWFGHVEKAMLKLSKKPYYSKAKHGYVRGREPVRYVRDIRDRYQAYVELSRDWPPPVE